MLPFDLSKLSVESRNDLCMSLYRSLDSLMATPGGREYIESRTAEIQCKRIFTQKGGDNNDQR